MDSAMMEVTEGSEVCQRMTTAAALVLDMMQIESDVSAAAGNGAAVAVAGEHLLALARRHGRGRPLRRLGVQGAEVDRIAGSQLEHGRIYIDVTTAGELPGTFAVRALLESDLVGG
jgi:hypothetical protein